MAAIVFANPLNHNVQGFYFRNFKEFKSYYKLKIPLDGLDYAVNHDFEYAYTFELLEGTNFERALFNVFKEKRGNGKNNMLRFFKSLKEYRQFSLPEFNHIWTPKAQIAICFTIACGGTMKDAISNCKNLLVTALDDAYYYNKNDRFVSHKTFHKRFSSLHDEEYSGKELLTTYEYNDEKYLIRITN